MLSAPSLSLPLSSVNQTQNPFTGISICLFKEVQKQLPRKDHSVNKFMSLNLTNTIGKFHKIESDFRPTCWVFITIDA